MREQSDSEEKSGRRRRLQFFSFQYVREQNDGEEKSGTTAGGGECDGFLVSFGSVRELDTNDHAIRNIASPLAGPASPDVARRS